MKKNIITFLSILILASCQNDSENISYREKSISFNTSELSINHIEDLDDAQEVNNLSEIPENNKCIEVSSNLVENGDFSLPALTKSWKIFNLDDEPSLAWEVEWKNKKPCGKNIIDPRLEIQKYSGGQLVELDSDCQGNNQFTFNYPIKKERVKTLIKQKIAVNAGLYYKISFDLKKRSNSVAEHIKVSLGKRKKVIKNNMITTEFEKYEIIKKIRDKDIDSSGYAYLKFDPIGGKSDSFGLLITNISVKEVVNCQEAVKTCNTPKRVVSYNPVGKINEARKDSLKSLGEPNGEPYVSNNIQFTSLGRGGDIIFQFSPRIKNKVGPDLRVYETSGGNLRYDQYKEEADVYASNNLSKWIYLGKIKNDNQAPELGEVDLGKMKSAKYIKIVDTTSFSSSDGFDVDALKCMNQNNTDHHATVYYSDKTHNKIYSVQVRDDSVRLTEKDDFIAENGGAHIALSSNKNYLYEVEGKSPNTLSVHNLNNGDNNKLFNLNVPDTFGLGFSSSDNLYSISAKTDHVYKINPFTKEYKDLGDIYNYNIRVDLIGGDIAFTDQKMYIVSQEKGGKLYEVSLIGGALEAREVAGDLGKVSGLAILGYDDYLISVLEKNYMIRIKDGIVQKLELKGDLLQQGSGADLASQSISGSSDF